MNTSPEPATRARNPKPLVLAFVFALLGGIAATLSLGESVTVVDIAIGSGVCSGVGYLLGQLLWRRESDWVKVASTSTDSSNAAASPTGLSKSTNFRTVRRKMLATISAIYLLGLAGIGTYAVRSAEEIPATPARTTQKSCLEYRQPPADAEYWYVVYKDQIVGWTDEDRDDVWARNGPLIFDSKLLSCLRSTGGETIPAVPARTAYESENIITALIASSLGAIVLFVGVLIWTRPDDEQIAALAPSRGTGRPTSKPKGAQTPVSGVAGVAPSGTASITDPATALRQLKALHDEGILTDDEYETKRQALADQL